MDLPFGWIDEPEPIVIFGGSFDPPHMGHDLILSGFAKTVNHSRLVILPSNTQWQKPNITSFEHRYKMCELCFASTMKTYTSIVLSDLEYKQYFGCTCDVVEYIKECYPMHRVILCIGSDQLLNLYTWVRFDELVKIVGFYVLERPEHCPRSSDIRKDVDNNRDHLYRMVYRYIEENGLYGSIDNGNTFKS